MGKKQFFLLSIISFLLLNFSLNGIDYEKLPGRTTKYTSNQYRTKNFSYLIGKMPGFSEQLLKMHFTLYKGYVKNTNALIKQLREMADGGMDRTIAYGAMQRRLGWEFDGMYLHELYFENLGGKKALSPSDPLYRQISKDFGSYSKWMQNYKAIGMIRGIGWVILYKDPKDGHLRNVWINEHDVGHLAGGTPILVMDVWEHAYITEYGLARGEYIDAFFKNIDWEAASNRF